MLTFLLRAVAAVVFLLFVHLSAEAKDEIGEAVRIKTEVTGSSGPIEIKSPVYRDERIKTSNSGLGEFVFNDGTKLAVGWGSTVVVDKFVYDDTASAKKIAIKATKGTFRWISGNAGSSAYQIVTPAGTIGVRGTAFDLYVGRDGTTAVVLLNGRVQFCGANGCQELKRRCDCIIASRRGGVGQPQKVNREVLAKLGNTRALPFLSGNQALSRGFLSSSGCGLSSASLRDPGIGKTGRAINPNGPPRNRPDAPSKPSKPDAPSKPTGPSQPETPTGPDKPSEPGAPSEPREPDKPSKRDKPDKPDKPDRPGKGGKGGEEGGKGYGNGSGRGPGRGGRDNC